MKHTPGRRLLEGCYVSLVAALAATGAVGGSAAAYVAAIVLTLPFGVSATACVYGGYAALKGVGGLWAAPTGADGSDAAWLTISSGTLNVAALVAAAVADVLLAEHLIRRRA